MRVAAGHELEAEVLVEEWLKAVGEGVAGYVTPKVAVGAVVGNERARFFWCSGPTRVCGFIPPVGPTSATRRRKSPSRRWARRPASRSKWCGSSRSSTACGWASLASPLYSLVFHCRALGGELKAHPLECATSGGSPRTRPVPTRRRRPVGPHGVRRNPRRARRRALRRAPLADVARRVSELTDCQFGGGSVESDAAKSVRDDTPNFWNTRWRVLSTVRRLIPRSAAMSLDGEPLAARAAISRSRRVRLSAKSPCA